MSFWSNGTALDSNNNTLSSDPNSTSYVVPLTADSSTEGVLRKSLACSYWDVTAQEWRSIGVVMRGFSVEVSDEAATNSTSGSSSSVLQVQAICQSNHLTAFAIEDFSDITDAVEDRVSTILGNVKGISGISANLKLEDLNPYVMGTLISVVSLFVILWFVYRFCNRHSGIAQGRAIFVRFGYIRRTDIVDAVALEKLYYKQIGGCAFFRLIILHLLAANSLFCILLKHVREVLAFDALDKLYVLFIKVIVTFVVEALLLDPEAEWSFLVSIVDALLVNLITIPINYVLP